MSQLSAIEQQFDRLPPHSIDAEMCLLASMMLDPNLFAQVESIIDRDSFYQADHQIIYEMLLGLHKRNAPIDAVIVYEELNRRQLLEEVGGRAYIAQILGTVPSAAHGTHYANIVQEKATLRRLIAASNEILRAAWAPHEAADDVLEKARSSIDAIQPTQAGSVKIFGIEEILHEYMESKGAGESTAILTGMPDFDQHAGIFALGEYTIIGGRPGMGKSTLLRWLMKMWSRAGTCTGLIALEETKMKIAGNYVSEQASINNQHAATGKFDEQTMSRACAAVGEMANGMNGKWFGTDMAFTLPQVEAAYLRLARKHKCKIIGIDHMHIVVHRAERRVDALSEISSTFKRLAKETNTCCIATAQLSRGDKSVKIPPAPRCSDLRDCGSLEQDADTVLFIHRENYYDETKNDYCPVILGKRRNGPLGHIALREELQFQRFAPMREPQPGGIFGDRNG